MAMGDHAKLATFDRMKHKVERSEAVGQAKAILAGEDIDDRFAKLEKEEEIEAEEFLHLLDVLGSDELLMFSSDYPHWDFDSPLQALPPLPESVARKIYAENARAWYGL